MLNVEMNAVGFRGKKNFAQKLSLPCVSIRGKQNCFSPPFAWTHFLQVQQSQQAIIVAVKIQCFRQGFTFWKRTLNAFFRAQQAVVSSKELRERVPSENGSYKKLCTVVFARRKTGV